MKIGIIGAGTMGRGIAKAFILGADYEVLLSDISCELAESGLNSITKDLEKRVAKGKLTEQQMREAQQRIRVSSIKDFGSCNLVIEAASEQMTVKKKIFAELRTVCADQTIFATNTSSLSITEISASVGREVVGMHFFNPADVLALVEVVPGLTTRRETVEQVTAIASAIGKTPIEVQESAGFVVNRILVPMINEAVGVLADGIASAADIDQAMKLGANHPMGPLALADLIGIDVCLAIMEVLFDESRDGKYRPHPLMRKMVRGGLLGRKSGQGFYSYH